MLDDSKQEGTTIKLGFLDKLAAGVIANIRSLLISLFLIVAVFLLLAGAAGSPLIISPSTQIDMGGRLLLAIFGGGILAVFVLRSYAILQKPTQEEALTNALYLMATEYADKQISERLSEVIKEFHTLHKSPNFVDLYKWLHKSGILADHEFEELVTEMLRLGK